MTAETELPVEERILQLLQHLGIQKAHFAARDPGDWAGCASKHPEVIASMSLVCPNSIDPDLLRALASRLLVFSGDGDRRSQTLIRAVESSPEATLVTFHEYVSPAWADTIARFPVEVSSALLEFLARDEKSDRAAALPMRQGEGEVAGISYRIQGAGPPLLLFPLRLAKSQWEPILNSLSQSYCTITLGGAELGFVAVLEARGRSPGYLRMVRTLVEEAGLQPGEAVLDVGCGSGVLDRWLTGQTGGANRIVGMDINPYLLQEAAALAKRERLEGAIEFREGNAEALPLPDNGFDVSMSVTVLEEGDADLMLRELVRVTRPGGRVAIVVRAVDIPLVVNVPLRAEPKAKLEAPGGTAEARGCADASLYRRFHQVGLTHVKMLPQMALFAPPLGHMNQFLQGWVLSKLNREEQEEYRVAETQAVAEDAFFFAWPHHCAVGTKPG